MKSSHKIDIEKLYEQFRKPLFRYISYKVSDVHSAEEILNDVFFKASKSLETLNDNTKIQSWLYKIATNQIIDYYRKRKETYIDVNEEIPFNNDEQEEYFIKELDCCLQDFMKQLPLQYSSSLKAVYLDEFTQKEYADKEKINLSTVKSQIKRGKESLKTLFEECCTFEKNRHGHLMDCCSENNNSKKQ